MWKQKTANCLQKYYWASCVLNEVHWRVMKERPKWTIPLQISKSKAGRPKGAYGLLTCRPQYWKCCCMIGQVPRRYVWIKALGLCYIKNMHQFNVLNIHHHPILCESCFFYLQNILEESLPSCYYVFFTLCFTLNNLHHEVRSISV